MKRLFLVLCLLACTCMIAYAGNKKKQKKADEDTQNFRYELEYIKSAGTGLANVKVWSYSKKPHIAAEQTKKNAIHGVIFKGYAGSGATQPALVRDAAGMSTHPEFFEAFFAEGGDYMRYVVNAVGTPEVMKVGKEYKVSQIIQVNTAQLRKHLEQAGIIRGLASGF